MLKTKQEMLFGKLFIYLMIFVTAKCACHHHGCRIGVCYPANYHRQTVI